MLRKASANSSRGPLALLVGLASLAFVLSAFRGASLRAAADAAPNAPPPAPVRSVTDEYFGTKVVDPYRYMENLKDPQVEAWFKAQNDYTRAILRTFQVETHFWPRSNSSTNRHQLES